MELEEKFVNLWPAEASSESSDKEASPEECLLPEGRDPPPPLLVEREDLLVGRDAPVERVFTTYQSPVRYEVYKCELQMPDIMKLMKTALSEPYSIYTYRYFIHNWPQLCILAKAGQRCVGAIVCKLEMHHFNTRRGYIAMLAVDEEHRKQKIGRKRLW